MQNLINALLSADDDYLTALSNKGILKRAYKDLQSAEISAEYFDDSICVNVSGEKCTIVSTLAESTCTCPSRSICRHIITAILWLKNNFSNENEAASVREHTINHFEEAVESTLPQNLTDELSVFPLKEIQKAMKKRYYNAFIEKAEKGIFPHMEELRIITVDMPEENVVVKLIQPLEYSACTCHSKELCRHKAAAILTWQLKHKIVNLKEIKLNEEKPVHIDIADIHSTAEYTHQFLADILSSGLVRISDEIVENAESIAVMCHNSRLANSERMIREIKNRLQAYVLRKPEFKAEDLFSLIMENMILLEKILQTENTEVINRYLGEFKSTYEIFDSIEILPIAWREFSSVAGYRGEIYYFLNKDTNAENKYLTYSDIRPDFYENARKRGVSQAPWGLFGTVRELSKSEMRLRLPKLSGGKISASNETTATITGKVNLNQRAVYENIYTDFSRMVYDIFSKEKAPEKETDRLVMFAVKKCIRSEFDNIEQTQNIVVEDNFNHILTVKGRYSADNKAFIKELIAIGELMLKNTNKLLFNKQFVIFGSIYMEKGKVFIYPMAVFDNIKIQMYNNDSKSSQSEIPVMKHSEYFFKLFKEIKEMLCDIIQCGINSFDLYSQVDSYALESEKTGLLILSEKLRQLSENLQGKNHTLKTDNTKIIRLMGEIYRYICIGQQKTEVGLALENLRIKENDNT